MKKLVSIATTAALVLSLGTAAYATDTAQTSQETQVPAERPLMNEQFGHPGLDLETLVSEGVITQEECDSIEAYLEENKPELPEMNGQPPQTEGEAPEFDGEKPEGHPGPDFEAMVSEGVISQETCDSIEAYLEENRPELP
ncbi:MAG: hypothetical protein K6F52_05740, partial [Clostridia bacterium]|nr:hypothetical protein [Clostridia bacterium]